MENWKKALLAGTALASTSLLTAPAEAQLNAGTFTTQSSNRPDAAQMTTATSTNCTATQTTVGNITLTITPPAGQYVYLSSFNVSVLPNATGSNSATVYSSTNLTGSPVWLIGEFSNAAGFAATTPLQINDTYPTGLKSTSPGTAVTLVPAATLASASVCPRATAWFGP
jgi:hypothetical protein